MCAKLPQRLRHNRRTKNKKPDGKKDAKPARVKTIEKQRNDFVAIGFPGY